MSKSIEIEVKSILIVKKVMGSGDVRLSLPEGGTVADLLAALVERWGEDLQAQLFDPSSGELWPHIHVMVNGRHFAFTGRMETVLKDGDSVLIMPPAGGG